MGVHVGACLQIVTNQYKWAWLASAAAALCFANTSLDSSCTFSDGRYIFMLNIAGLILQACLPIEITVQALNDKRSDMSPPPACPAVPGLLEAPVVGKVTHHTVELSWRPPDHTSSAGRLHYCVQEEEKGRGFTDVYK